MHVCKKLWKARLEGFSLLEMSLVLAIIGIVAGLTLPMLIESQAQAKRRVTKGNMDFVLSALGTFAATQGRLPVPCQSPKSGEEPRSAQNICGYIPFKTLGISERASKDGFGHPIRYAVDPIFTTSDGIITKVKNTPTSSTHLVIKNQYGFSVLGTRSDADTIAVVLIAENEAYANPEGEAENLNVTSHPEYKEQPYSSNPDNPFRHIVRWSTRHLLLTHYGQSSLPKALQHKFPETSTPPSSSSAPPPTPHHGTGGVAH